MLLSVAWIAALRGIGVRLRPDGIEDRQAFGSIFVPWEALGAPPAILDTWWGSILRGERQVNLVLTDPALVRKRGLRYGPLNSLTTIGVDPGFLAGVIGEYADRPDLRSAIGVPEELARF
ncbi:hypothetical protein GCM10010112_19880 [Actinoplanes lobatus]|uniref:Uncharacterized protein n=1 Tax=Actinoplanes lobatus TaxID=113568 RepID=A0A7W7HPK7_9ACTN|nr:hypothetical protein [Actinoplanes lobatus]MBB4754244.1 hypothetical protein [Actinoplanes lobatus]GGN62072.1 hypothetical protein GCM10010112_19880 [Actinoplanes lobatus]GIE44878.1 hypothetical protein Alo02nite_77760 [Actinoplanes lobatus]